MQKDPRQPTITPLRRGSQAVPYVIFFTSLFVSIAALFSLFTLLFHPTAISLPFLNHATQAMAFPSKERFTLLALGVDSDQDPRRSDTMILLFVDRSKKSLAALSIPRDSRVPIPGHSLDKITHAYAFGGLELSKATVESLIGKPVDYYATVDFRGFMKIVNLLGGVPIRVEKAMHYRDRAQKLYIHLSPGLQTLNGYAAMGYVRFRHDRLGDLGRIQRQQNFIRAVLKESLQIKHIFQWPKLIQTSFSLVQTNLPYGLLLSLARDFKDFNASNMTSLYLPGSIADIRGISYFVPDLDYLRQVISEFDSGTPLPFLGLDLQVLNGTGKLGLATRVQQQLAEQGIPVTSIGDAERHYATTLLRFPRTHEEAAKEIEHLFPESKIEWVETSGKAILILGENTQRGET